MCPDAYWTRRGTCFHSLSTELPNPRFLYSRVWSSRGQTLVRSQLGFGAHAVGEVDRRAVLVNCRSLTASVRPRRIATSNSWSLYSGFSSSRMARSATKSQRVQAISFSRSPLRARGDGSEAGLWHLKTIDYWGLLHGARLDMTDKRLHSRTH